MNTHEKTAPSPNTDAADFLLRFDPTGRHNLVALDPNGGKSEGRTFSPGDRDGMAAWAGTNSGKNLYFSVNEPVPGAPDKKLTKDDIANIRAIPVDIDPRRDAPFVEERSRLGSLAQTAKESPTAPTLILDSGGGYQFFWNLGTKLPATPENAQWAEEQGRGLAHALGGGDAVQNIDRIMRLPFTTNHPNERKRAKGRRPAPARIVSETPRTYTPDALRAYATPRTAGTTVVDISPDVERLRSEIDMSVAREPLSPECSQRFENHKRTSPKLRAIVAGDALPGDDQSGSAYRFALARELASRGDYTITEYTQIACSLPQCNTRKDIPGGWERAFARDWAKVSPKPPEWWFQPIPEPPGITKPEVGPLLVDFPIRLEDIPRREWLAYPAPAIPLGEAVLFVGPPKAAKSAWTIALALCVLCGDPAPLFGTGCRVPGGFRRGKVLLVNNEDPSTEMLRRLTAATSATGVKPPGKTLALLSGADTDAPRLAVLRRERGGAIGITPGYAHLAKIIDEFQPDLVVFDSLVSMAEGLSENDNSEMDRLARTLRSLAARSGATALLVHHTNKDKTGAAGDPTAARGAFSLYGAVRSSLTLIPMSEDDVKKAGFPPGRYVRMDDSGGNYSTRDERAHVWRIERGEVGNGTGAPHQVPQAAAFFDDEFSGKRGDTAPVLQYLGAFSLTGKRRKANGVSAAAKDEQSATVAHIIKATLGEESDRHLNAELKGVLAERLHAARLLSGRSASSAEKLIRETIPASGVEISENGQIVRVYRRPISGGAKAAIHVGWEELRSFAREAACEGGSIENA